MRHSISRLVALAVALLVAACGSSSQQEAQRTFALAGHAMSTCSLRSGVVALCGSLAVPENPSIPSGRHINLRVVVVPAQESPVALDPVFFVAGGPGGASSEDWSNATMTFPSLNLHHDFVLVDQRGTGHSNRLELPPPNPGESLPDYAKRALASIDADPRYYTTAVAMDDLDAVRSALGYGKIDLYGTSYGATAVQYYMRQHGAHVRSAVLDGGTLLDVPIMELIAANSQRALDQVFDRCLSDLTCATAFPNLRKEMSAVMARLDRAAVTTSVFDQATGKPIVVDHETFAGVIHSKLLNAADSATIPWLVHRAATGNFDEIAAAVTGDTPMLLMSYEIRCTEAWGRFDPAEVRRTGAGSYYESAQEQAAVLQAAGCAQLPIGIAPANDDQPLRTSVPVLLLNGGADPQDPPSNVADAQVDMPNSLTVVVPGQGHVVGAFGCLPAVVSNFIDTAKTDAAAANSCAQSIATPAFQVP